MTELVSIDFIDADTYTDLAQELAPKWRTTTDHYPPRTYAGSKLTRTGRSYPTSNQ